MIAKLFCIFALACLCACSTLAPRPAPVCAPRPPAPAPEARAPSEAALLELLAYQASVRQLTPPELGRALAEQSGQRASAKLLLRRAMLLAAQKGSGDMARAQNLLDGMVADDPALVALAQTLAASYADARRQEEAAERLAAQLREARARNEQLADKLEALKSIERTLSIRAPGVTGSAK